MLHIKMVLQTGKYTNSVSFINFLLLCMSLFFFVYVESDSSPAEKHVVANLFCNQPYAFTF